MDASALSGAWNVVWRIGWAQNLIDDVNYTVAGVDICKRNVGSVDHHTVTDGEGKRLSVDCCSAHAISHCGGGNCAAYNVVEQNIGESGFPVRGVERCKVDTSIDERLVGWCKDREWAVALERFQQFCLDYGSNQ